MDGCRRRSRRRGSRGDETLRRAAHHVKRRASARPSEPARDAQWLWNSKSQTHNGERAHGLKKTAHTLAFTKPSLGFFNVSASASFGGFWLGPAVGNAMATARVSRISRVLSASRAPRADWIGFLHARPSRRRAVLAAHRSRSTSHPQSHNRSDVHVIDAQPLCWRRRRTTRYGPSMQHAKSWRRWFARGSLHRFFKTHPPVGTQIPHANLP